MKVKIDKKNNIVHYNYKGSLVDEIKKCEKELSLKSKELLTAQLLADRFKKELNSIKNRISYLQDFISLAKEKNNNSEVK